MHCYSTEGSTADELNSTQATQLLKMCAAHDVLTLGIGGGEPFLRSDLLQLLREARDYGFNVFLMTNGHFITLEAAHMLARNEIHVSVSLDGANAVTHDRLRGTGSFRKTVNSLVQLTEAGVLCNLLFTVFKWNVQELASLTEKAETFKAESVVVNRPIALGRGAHITDAFLTPTEYKTLMTQIASLRDQGVPISVDENLYHLYSIVDEHFQVDCPAGRTMCAITPEGRVKPCPGLPQLTGESILHEDIGHVWRNSTAFSPLRELSEEIVPCRECQFFSTCRGGCRAAAMAAYNCLTAPDPDCWICEQIKGVETYETD